MNDAKQPQPPVEIHRLFHSLWTKAVGTPTYDKEQWRQMDNFLHCKSTRSLAGEAAQPQNHEVAALVHTFLSFEEGAQIAALRELWANEPEVMKTFVAKLAVSTPPAPENKCAVCNSAASAAEDVLYSAKLRVRKMLGKSDDDRQWSLAPMLSQLEAKLKRLSAAALSPAQASPPAKEGEK